MIKTEEEFKKLKTGTPVKIKEDVECHPMFKKDGNTLIMGRSGEPDPGDRDYGIKIDGLSACYEFEWYEFEILENGKS